MHDQPIAQALVGKSKDNRQEISLMNAQHNGQDPTRRNN